MFALYLERGREELVLVQVPILIVHRVVKRDDDHLRHLVGIQPAGHERAVRRAEAVGQRAVGVVADGGGVGVVGRVAPPLVATVKAVGMAVAEQLCRQARAATFSSV